MWGGFGPFAISFTPRLSKWRVVAVCYSLDANIRRLAGRYRISEFLGMTRIVHETVFVPESRPGVREGIPDGPRLLAFP